MNAKRWKSLIRSLPKGLTQVQAARYLNIHKGAVRYWIKRLGYKFSDGRKQSWPETRRQERRMIDYSKIDFSLANSVNAKLHGVSRERIRQIRQELGLPKINGRKTKPKTTKTK